MASGALTIVWPTCAKPKASSAWRICHVSWKPLTKVPWVWDVAALLDVAAQAEVAVADREQRLGDAEVLGREARLDERATRRPGTGCGRRVSRQACGGSLLSAVGAPRGAGGRTG